MMEAMIWIATTINAYADQTRNIQDVSRTWCVVGVPVSIIR